MALDKLTPQALKAAMEGGTQSWGQWGSAVDHALYVEPIDRKQRKGRRKCHCGCGKMSTHRGMANGVCLTEGCEMQMHRWKRRWEKVKNRPAR